LGGCGWRGPQTVEAIGEIVGELCDRLEKDVYLNPRDVHLNPRNDALQGQVTVRKPVEAVGEKGFELCERLEMGCVPEPEKMCTSTRGIDALQGKEWRTSGQERRTPGQGIAHLRASNDALQGKE
jgi:hypothetical protein